MKKTLFVIFFIIFSFIISGALMADEIEEEVKRGLDAYHRGEYSEAIGSFEFAAQQIRQMKASETQELFPPPLPGWKAEEGESAAMGNAFMGGMITNSRRYFKGSSSVTIEIITDSPLIPMVTAMFANPAFGAYGAKVMRISGEKAILEWDSSASSGELKLVVDNQVLVTVSGDNCKESNIIDYANSIDYDAVRALASK